MGIGLQEFFARGGGVFYNNIKKLFTLPPICALVVYGDRDQTRSEERGAKKKTGRPPPDIVHVLTAPRDRTGVGRAN